MQTDLERVQKRALACIFPGKPYAEALSIRPEQDLKP